MAEYYNKKANPASSTTAKAGLGLGIAGTALGVLAAGANGGIIGALNPFAPRAVPVATPAAVTVDVNGTPIAVGGYVSDKEMCLYRQLDKSENENAVLRSEKYTVEYVAGALAPIYNTLAHQNQEICDLKAGLAMESERRSCGDEKIVTYVDGHYIKAEKSINSRHVNYHGCKPVIEINECCCTGATE